MRTDDCFIVCLEEVLRLKNQKIQELEKALSHENELFLEWRNRAETLQMEVLRAETLQMKVICLQEELKHWKEVARARLLFGSS